MAQAVDLYTEENIELIHVINWSSINSRTGAGAFSIKTGDLVQIQEFRAIVRGLFIAGRTYETFPKLALIKKYSLTMYIPASVSHFKPNKLIALLRTCDRDLKGCLLYTSDAADE